MKAHIVLAHPEIKSFNGHLSDTSQRVLGAAGWQHTLFDLYALDFDPREGSHHYRSRKDADVFHAQSEQRFNAENESMPSDVRAEIQCLLDCDLLVVHFWPILFSFRYLGFDVLEPAICHGVGGVAFIEGHESGLSTLDAYSKCWVAVLETLSSRPLVQYNRDHDFDETKRLRSEAPVHSPFVRHKPDAIRQ